MTYDIDVVVAMNVPNIERFEEIMAGLNLTQQQPVALISLVDPEERRRFTESKNLVAVTFTDVNNPVREVDLLVSPQPPSEQILASAVIFQFGGREVKVVGIERLIEMKQASDRYQDLDDVLLLQEFKKGV